MEEIKKPESVHSDTEEVDLKEDAVHAVQDFNQLRQACLSTKKLFEDPQFPAQDSSVYFSKRPDFIIEWKRPTEIANDPKLYVEGFSRFDLSQGSLSDCWFIAAVANLAMHPNLFCRVVPEDQSFQVNYAGIFHFRFWQYGNWVDVVIDDRLPTNQGKLMYLSSPENKEFWGALLEKAYAKLHGSYEALVDGMNYEAMEDFTGGIVEMYNMNTIPSNLFNILLKAKERNSLIGCILEEIANAPKLYVEGFSRFDLSQGSLSDCWFIAAVANLAMHPNLFCRVVPEDQSFQVNYAGIFHFRFWQYGNWVDVVIDDRLPTNQGKLMYLSSPENKEFWGALLEKAYAKLHGSYEALVDGMNYEAMEDFTGGIVEMYNMNTIPSNLFNILLKAKERNSLIGCILEQGLDASESETPEGLIRWHCYSITDVKCVNKQTVDQSEEVLLIRLRNPWGNKHEWNGKWSDKSPEWLSVSDSEKEELGLKFDFDGEFWMTFQDFKQYFSTLDICNLSPDSLMEPNSGNKKWELIAVEGEWVRGVSAGGCDRFPDTFWQNPQYRITLDHPDEGDDKCTVILALSQKNQRAQKWKGVVKVHVGFVIYHLKDPKTLPKPLDKSYLDNHRNKHAARSAKFLTNRGVNGRFQLKTGVYCIIPCTFEPNEEAKFSLRIFSDNENTNMKEKNEEVAVDDIANTVRKIHENVNSCKLPNCR